MSASESKRSRLKMRAYERVANFKFAVAIMALLLCALAAHSYYYLPFIADDALIALRYAQRLAAGQGLNWNAGEYVEGYSNLLWVLCAALLHKLGLNLVTAVRLLGVLGMGLAMLAVLYAHAPGTLRRALPIAIALLFLPLAAPFAAWTIGGMEQPLVAGLLAWAVVLTYRRFERLDAPAKEMLLPGLLFALLCLARLDGALFTVAAVTALFLNEGLTRASLKRVAALCLLPALFLAGQAAFRLAYYGEWVPNVALVKFTPSGKHALDGLGYLREGALALLPLVLLAAASVVVSFRHNFLRSRVVLLLSLTLVWAAYLVLIGGDIFPAWRHFVPLVLLLVMLAAIGAEWVGTVARGRAYLSIVLAGVLLLCVFVPLQFRDSENARAKSERWEWDGQVIGTLLKKAFGAQQPLMAVDPAGCLPFWSELPSLDMLGLNDYYLPRHPPANLGQGAIGHELGDGRYVLDRQPDLVVFLLPTGNDQGYFLSGQQMQQDPRFYRDYTLVWFEGREPYAVRSRIWVRKYSERIGIRRAPDRVEVPGFLLSDNPATITYLDAAGALVVPATRAEPARLKNLALAPGLWRIEVEAARPEATRIKALQSAAGVERQILEADAPALLDLRQSAGESSISIEVRPSTIEKLQVRGLKLTRIKDEPEMSFTKSKPSPF